MPKPIWCSVHSSFLEVLKAEKYWNSEFKVETFYKNKPLLDTRSHQGLVILNSPCILKIVGF